MIAIDISILLIDKNLKWCITLNVIFGINKLIKRPQQNFVKRGHWRLTEVSWDWNSLADSVYLSTINLWHRLLLCVCYTYFIEVTPSDNGNANKHVVAVVVSWTVRWTPESVAGIQVINVACFQTGQTIPWKCKLLLQLLFLTVRWILELEEIL